MGVSFVTKHIYYGLEKRAAYVCVTGSSVCSSVEKRLTTVESNRLTEESGKK